MIAIKEKSVTIGVELNITSVGRGGPVFRCLAIEVFEHSRVFAGQFGMSVAVVILKQSTFLPGSLTTAFFSSTRKCKLSEIN